MENATNIGLVVIALSALVSLAGGLMNIFGRSQKREIGPNPLEVRAAAQYVTAGQMNQHEAANDRRASTIEQTLQELMHRMDGLDRSDEARTSGIHRRLNVLSTNIATLAGRMAGLSGQQVTLVHDGDQG
jgi:hypothetical protein